MPVPQNVSLPGKSIYDLMFEMYPYITPDAQAMMRQQPMRIGYGSGDRLLDAVSGPGNMAATYAPWNNMVSMGIPYTQMREPWALQALMHEMTHAWAGNQGVANNAFANLPLVGRVGRALGMMANNIPLSSYADPSRINYIKETAGGYSGPRLMGMLPWEVFAETVANNPGSTADIPEWVRPSLKGLVNFDYGTAPKTSLPPANGTWNATPSYPAVTKPSLQQSIQSKLSTLRAPVYTPPASGTWSATAPQIPHAVSPSYNSNMSIFDLVSQTRR